MCGPYVSGAWWRVVGRVGVWVWRRGRRRGPVSVPRLPQREEGRHREEGGGGAVWVKGEGALVGCRCTVSAAVV